MKQQNTERSGEIEGGGVNQQSLFVYHVLTLRIHRIHYITLYLQHAELTL
jgi:hydroxyacyl-ACP dehydratase HTD2-like protein with hotdog domain